jgi:HAMP domain-containing protein
MESSDIIALTGIIAPVIGSLTAIILAAWVSGNLSKLKKSTKTIAAQVNNDHVADPGKTSNLREDIDEKHDITTQKIEQVLSAVDGLRGDLQNTNRIVSTLVDSNSNHTKQIADLEKTQPRANVRQTRKAAAKD